ncbi:hypothetical protein AFCA_004215 [Aspergillus flavus]|uniref:BTB domain-containing protein n=1 Tax=Aspergillus flavus TaxID=5059 RepID=A0AB74C056_ASPFL|nr:hypothetical protein CA14_000822 [Aspergillus flavus]UDD56687.1 hypothetical protein AFCA_004215 [Aspergillus flavus]
MPVESTNPDGDIFIECGDNLFQVCSKVLSAASPVLSAMFSPHFKERTSIVKESEGPGVIPLSGDDPEALITFCNIVHFRTDEIPENPSPTFLEDFATLIDKYMCKKAVASQVKLWLMKNLQNLTVTQLCPLLLLAYVMDLPERFAAISKEILFAHAVSYTDLSLLVDHPLIHSNIVVDFERKRRELYRIVRKAITSVLNSLTAFKTDESKYVTLYTWKLQACGLLPGTDVFEAKSFKQVHRDALKLPKCHPGPCNVSGCVCMSIKALKQDAELLRLLSNCRKAKVGMCLDCLRSNGLSFPKCRYTHPSFGDDKAIFTEESVIMVYA